MRRRGMVFKAEILAHVWDFNFDGDQNVVEVHMSSLRRKIDAASDRSAVETVRGVGYRLVIDDR